MFEENVNETPSTEEDPTTTQKVAGVAATIATVAIGCRCALALTRRLKARREARKIENLPTPVDITVTPA